MLQYTEPKDHGALLSWVQVVQAARDRIPVFLDGGVRRGTDVLKALALGAKGVFVSAYFAAFLSPEA